MWGVGQRGRDNGILVLWVPTQRAVHISVGYGLEGVLPDARAGRIRDEAIFPAFRRNDFDAGMLAGVAELAAARRSQVGTGERAEKIRTYNFPENRLTDHRVKHTVHRLDHVLDGDLEEFTDALQAEERRRALEAAV